MEGGVVVTRADSPFIIFLCHKDETRSFLVVQDVVLGQRDYLAIFDTVK